MRLTVTKTAKEGPNSEPGHIQGGVQPQKGKQERKKAEGEGRRDPGGETGRKASEAVFRSVI